MPLLSAGGVCARCCSSRMRRVYCRSRCRCRLAAGAADSLLAAALEWTCLPGPSWQLEPFWRRSRRVGRGCFLLPAPLRAGGMALAGAVPSSSLARRRTVSSVRRGCSFSTATSCGRGSIPPVVFQWISRRRLLVVDYQEHRRRSCSSSSALLCGCAELSDAAASVLAAAFFLDLEVLVFVESAVASGLVSKRPRRPFFLVFFCWFSLVGGTRRSDCAPREPRDGVRPVGANMPRSKGCATSH